MSSCVVLGKEPLEWENGKDKGNFEQLCSLEEEPLEWENGKDKGNFEQLCSFRGESPWNGRMEKIFSNQTLLPS